MENKKIKIVKVGCGRSEVWYESLESDAKLFTFRQCHELKDESFTDPSGRYTNRYSGYDNKGKLLFEIINQPVTIEYERIYDVKENTDNDDIPF
jgi:hypothetical protein